MPAAGGGRSLILFLIKSDNANTSSQPEGCIQDEKWLHGRGESNGIVECSANSLSLSSCIKPFCSKATLKTTNWIQLALRDNCEVVLFTVQ